MYLVNINTHFICIFGKPKPTPDVGINFHYFRLTESIQIMFAFQNLFSYPLQSYVPYEIVWNNYLKSNKKVIEYEKLCSTLLRMLIPWLTGEIYPISKSRSFFQPTAPTDTFTR